MWGICLDNLLYDGKLFHQGIEYRVINETNKAVIIKPVSGYETDINKIRAIGFSPKYSYGDYVYPVSHPERKGYIIDMIWHFNNQSFYYFIEVNNKKIKTRYYEDDLRFV